MAVTEGTYVLLSAKDQSFALDVQGGVDDSGRLVQLWTRNGGDAQLLKLLKRGGTDNTYRVLFVLSGKSLDRYNNGYANGTVVQQWDSISMDHPAQMWEIIEDGKQVSVNTEDGTKTFNSVILKHPDYESCLDIEAGVISDGTRVQMYERNGTDAQRWVLLPKTLINNGTYVIRSALNTSMVIDCANGGTTNGTNVQLYSENGSDAQSWKVVNYQDGTCRLICLANNMSMDVDDGLSNINGANIQVWQTIDTDPLRDNQLFVPVAYGSMQYLGNDWPTYRINVFAGDHKCVDASGGQSALGTNIRSWEQNGSKAQTWIFTPTEGVSENLPVPTSGGFVIGKTVASLPPTTNMQIPNPTATVYPAWICEGDKYQLRYKYRGRPINASFPEERSEWSQWKSIRDGSTANEGYGNIGEANCTTVSVGDYKVSEKGIQLDFNNEYSFYEFQFEVNRYEQNSSTTALPVTGNKAGFGVSVSMITPVYLVPTAYMTPLGLRITYSSGWTQGGNSLSVESDDFGRYDFGNVKGSDTVTIPIDILPKYYEEGDKIKLSLVFTNTDGVKVRTNGTVVVGPDGGTIDFTATVTVNGNIANVKLSDSSGQVWLNVKRPHGNKLISCTKLDDYNFFVVPPIGVEWEVVAIVEDGSDYGYKKVTKSPIVEEMPTYHICSLDGSNDLPVIYNESAPGPTFEPSYKRDSTSIVTTGRERTIVSFGNTVQTTFTLNGNLAFVDFNDARAMADKAAHMSYGIFRSPHGYWAYVAIKGVSVDYADYWKLPISVEMEEVDL